MLCRAILRVNPTSPLIGHLWHHQPRARPDKMVSRVLFWAGFGTDIYPPFIQSLFFFLSFSAMIAQKHSSLDQRWSLVTNTTGKKHTRRRDPRMAARPAKDFTPRPQNALGIPNLCRNWRRLRILASDCRREAGCDIAGEETGYSGEARTEGSKRRGSCTRDGIGEETDSYVRANWVMI